MSSVIKMNVFKKTWKQCSKAHMKFSFCQYHQRKNLKNLMFLLKYKLKNEFLKKRKVLSVPLQDKNQKNFS